MVYFKPLLSNWTIFGVCWQTQSSSKVTYKAAGIRMRPVCLQREFRKYILRVTDESCWLKLEYFCPHNALQGEKRRKDCPEGQTDLSQRWLHIVSNSFLMLFIYHCRYLWRPFPWPHVTRGRPYLKSSHVLSQKRNLWTPSFQLQSSSACQIPTTAHSDYGSQRKRPSF